MRLKITVKIILFLLTAIWCLGIFNQFIFDQANSGVISLITDNVYSNVCHQNPERLIGDSENTMVCARCTGIYSGVLILSLILLLIRKNLKLSIVPLILLLLPMLIDVILTSTEIYSYSKYSAFITGFLSGSVVIVYIHDAINKFFIEIKSENKA